MFADAPWYVSNLQLHEDLEVTYIAEHIRDLAQSFDSKIPDVTVRTFDFGSLIYIYIYIYIFVYLFIYIITQGIGNHSSAPACFEVKRLKI